MAAGRPRAPVSHVQTYRDLNFHQFVFLDRSFPRIVHIGIIKIVSPSPDRTADTNLEALIALLKRHLALKLITQFRRIQYIINILNEYPDR